MTFPIPRPKAQPGPAKAPIRYVRCAEFESGTQAIFGRPRMPAIHIENAEQGRASADRRWIDAYDQAGTKK